MTADEEDLESIRVLHLTDPHLFADADGELRGTVTQDSLQRVLKHYEAGDWRADRALITGDLIQDDSAEAYERFKKLLLPLNMRMHCVPGNHDIRNLMRPVCNRPPFSYCAREEIRDWLLLGLDTCVKGEAGGNITQKEFKRMEKTIRESSARYILIFLHHPPVAMGSKWLDTVLLKNGDELLVRLQSDDRVRALIFGHVHQPYDADHVGIRVLGTPSTCSQFMPGSDDFELDTRPPAYRRITLGDDGSFKTKLIWVND